MAAAIENIKPDAKFIKQISSLSGGTLKKCFQCGSCSVICSLSPDSIPFPRKEMIWTQWGLKDRLLKDPDIWLCHNCNDCSTYCPRGAKPGNVLATIRNYAIMNFVLPGFLMKSFSPFGYLFSVLAVMILLYLLPLTAHVQVAFHIVFGLSAIITAIGLVRFWNHINQFEGFIEQSSQNYRQPPKKGFLPSLALSLGEIIKQTNFSRCGVNSANRYAHQPILYGSILLLAGHIIPIILRVSLSSLLNTTLNVAAFIGALALFSGLTLLVYRRLFKKPQAGSASYFDWLFITLLYLVITAGLLTKLSLATGMTLFPIIYRSHLVLLFTLLVYAPFSKFSHMFYRTLAMTYSRQIGRELKPEIPGGKESQSI